MTIDLGDNELSIYETLHIAYFLVEYARHLVEKYANKKRTNLTNDLGLL
ncbi:MAG: hypothetical protein V7K45_24060 [Nostoc sp.]